MTSEVVKFPEFRKNLMPVYKFPKKLMLENGGEFFIISILLP